MSCSPFDLRDYFFGELGEADRRQADLHLKSCAGCREELAELQSTQAVLMAAPDEEIPQRIGFISDRVYEPSVARRWWNGFWGSTPRLGFASAAMLSAALVVFALHRPAPVPAPVVSAPAVDVVKLQAHFSRQLEKAVADSDARHQEHTAELLSAAEKRFEATRRADMEVVSQNFRVLQTYQMREMRAALFTGGTR